jgi:pyruvate,orthophosphate dikinase
MVHEGVVTEREALLRIDPYKCSYFVEDQIAANEDDSGAAEGVDSMAALGGAKQVPQPMSTMRICVSGLAASQGIISGVFALTAEECARLSMTQDVILCISESNCTLEDYAACRSAAGVLCIGGTLVSDVAMICRNLGKPCVVAVGSTPLRLEAAVGADPSKRPTRLLYGSGETLCAGDHVTLDGTCGKLYLGKPSLTVHKKDPNYLCILKWADKYRRLRVNTSIATGTIVDAMRIACDLGTDGFGCISTDPLFYYTGDRLSLTRMALFSQSVDERNRHISVLGELHREDFKGIFRASEGKPICIKLLDTSLNYLLPSSERFGK